MPQAEKQKPATAANGNGHGLKNSSNILPQNDFRQWAAGLGYSLNPVADGQKHRFEIPSDKGGKKSGAYCLYADGGGYVKDYKNDVFETWQSGKSESLLSDKEVAEMQQRQRKREEERRERQANAAQDAAGIWQQSTPADPSHPYLVTKAIRPHGIRQHGKALLVPAYNTAGNLQTLQSIDESGNKKFMPGGKVSGAYCLIGEPQDGQPLYIVEGYATAATVHETTGAAATIAFNAGHLEAVATALAELHPEARLVICCDNDTTTEGNPGLTKGRQAAAAIDAPYALPVFTNGTGSDFNDLNTTEGREAVLRCLAKEYATAWPPLGKANLAPLPAFPWDCLPPVLREHAQQVASTYQVPSEYPAMAALTVAGFAMGNRTFVSLKQGVSVRPNLYTFVVMASGERKSSAYRPLTEPLDAYGIEHAESWQELQREKRIHKAKVARLEKELSKPLSRDSELETRNELSQLVEPLGTCKDYLAENATEEALQVKLVDCGERAAVFSADSRDVLQVLTGIYNDRQNRETTYLKGFDGDSLRVQRMSRTLHLEHPSISLLLCVQEDKLSELGANGGLWAGGFIPRLLFIVPDSLVGGRFWTEHELDAATQEAYNAAVTARLDKFSEQEEDCIFPLDGDAKAIWIEFYNALESDMAGELSDHAPLAARWQTLPVRLACIIAEYNNRDSIALDDMNAAIELSGYLIAHQRRAAGIMGKGLSSELERAVHHIRGKNLTKFKPNDVRRAANATAADVDKWLDELETLGYIRATGEVEGHKRAAIYESNPAIWNE